MKHIKSYNIFENNKHNNIYEVYHASYVKFKKFDINKATNISGDLYGKGFYFSDNLNYIKKFGDIIYKCSIVLNNPLDFTKKSINKQLLEIIKNVNNISKNDLEYINDSIKYNNTTSAFRKIRKYVDYDVLSELYDGIIGHCEEGGYEYVVYDSNAIKILRTY